MLRFNLKINRLMKNITIIFLVITSTLFGCKKYLDVVPDNIATLENAFKMRNTAEKYLFTCYSYLPREGDSFTNPAFVAGDENWFLFGATGTTENTGVPVAGPSIARGNQNKVDPYLNFWAGSQGIAENKGLFKGIRDCNIFIENIGRVPGMDDFEKERWKGEAKFLKAYYNFWLLRMYGPIPVIRENLPITAGPEEVKVKRAPVDDVFNYIVELLDEAALVLPSTFSSESTERGRITLPIALALKAKVLVYAASPLFNGNRDYANFKNVDGTALFTDTYDPEKWRKATVACKEAIDKVHELGGQLYNYSQSVLQYNVSAQTKLQLSIRNAVTEKWNREIIWGNTNSLAINIQSQSLMRGLDATKALVYTAGNFSPPLEIVELFYSKKGIPIKEDPDWDYSGRYSIKTVTDVDKYYMKTGYRTAKLNFDREPRFYADLSFDGAIWFGQGRYDDATAFNVESKMGQKHSRITPFDYPLTGYQPKKLVNYQTAVETALNVTSYPWPNIRLADLYLLYAESLNELNGPDAEASKYINLVRERAGLRTVEESWKDSTKPGKPSTKQGFREIVHQERAIELSFEGHRFWDLLRWKEAATAFNGPVRGWDVDQKDEDAYYKPKVLFIRTFSMRDYFWPLKEADIIVNRNLVQNPGW